MQFIEKFIAAMMILAFIGGVGLVVSETEDRETCDVERVEKIAYNITASFDGEVESEVLMRLIEKRMDVKTMCVAKSVEGSERLFINPGGMFESEKVMEVPR